MALAFPVLLVIRNCEREVRWMEVCDWLKHASDSGRKPVKQTVFAGEGVGWGTGVIGGDLCRPFRAWGSWWARNPGRRSLTRFALGYLPSGLRPFRGGFRRVE